MTDIVIRQLYTAYRASFLAFMAKWCSCSKEEIEDLYQETFVAFCENVQNGKYQPQNGVSVQSYLYQIGKYKYYTRQRDQKICTEPIDDHLLSLAEEGEQKQETAEEITYEFIQTVDPACRSILTLYYWERLRMEEIAKRLNLKNEQVAKNKKSICLRKIKSALKQRLNENGIEL